MVGHLLVSRPADCVGLRDAEKILLDMETWEVERPKKRKHGLFHQDDAGFACVRSCWSPCSDLLWVSATVPRPLTCAKRPKMARPLNNAGLYQVRVHNRAFSFLISLQKWRGFFHLIARILAKNKKNLIYQCSCPYTGWFTITFRRQTQEIESPDYSTLILRFWR